MKLYQQIIHDLGKHNTNYLTSIQVIVDSTHNTITELRFTFHADVITITPDMYPQEPFSQLIGDQLLALIGTATYLWGNVQVEYTIVGTGPADIPGYWQIRNPKVTPEWISFKLFSIDSLQTTAEIVAF